MLQGGGGGEGREGGGKGTKVQSSGWHHVFNTETECLHAVESYSTTLDEDPKVSSTCKGSTGNESRAGSATSQPIRRVPRVR